MKSSELFFDAGPYVRLMVDTFIKTSVDKEMTKFKIERLTQTGSEVKLLLGVSTVSLNSPIEKMVDEMPPEHAEKFKKKRIAHVATATEATKKSLFDLVRFFERQSRHLTFTEVWFGRERIHPSRIKKSDMIAAGTVRFTFEIK